jgi:peptidoglycan/xylan/chitin deacetylase (PgdA/CDA1 family)
LNAYAKGHEVGFHTRDHVALTTIPRDNMGLFNYQAIDMLESHNSDGIIVTSFAYPNGLWDEWMHEELLQTYKIVRGYDKYFHVFTVDTLKQGGYFPSKSIDYWQYKTDSAFEADIRKMFAVTKFLGDNNVIPLTSHTISLTDTGWAIRPYHLEYIFKTAEKFKLKFYKYNDFLE